MCGTFQRLVETVLAIGLAIGTRRLFIVALDLVGNVSLNLLPVYDESIGLTLRRRQNEHASTARRRGRPDAVTLLPDFGPM